MVPQQLLRPRTARILVVEDEVLIRALIAEELRLEGFSVIEADRADDALTYIKAGEQVDLVFSDIRMPGSLNGLQLAKTLREKYPDIPVILTSGNALPRHVGVVEAFVPKPYDVTQTIALMSAILAQESSGGPYERSLHLDRRAGLARENPARRVSSRVRLLRECGYLVLEACSAGDARTLLEDGSRRIDIVLAEVKSGEASGFALASWV